jgi:hypothetical protein
MAGRPRRVPAAFPMVRRKISCAAARRTGQYAPGRYSRSHEKWAS